MRCPTCKEQMGKRTGKYQYRESGMDNIWLTDWDIYECSGCNVRLPVIPNMERLKQAITRELVLQRSRLTGDAIVYLRKAIGLTSGELAEVLDVDRVSVSRWENDKSTIQDMSDFRLRLEAIDRVLADERRAIREAVSIIIQRGYKPQQEGKTISINLAAVAEFATAGL